MGLKKYRDKLKDGREALYVHYYNNGRRKVIRAKYKGVKLFSGKGEHFNKAHEIFFDEFYKELETRVLFKGESIQDVLNVDSSFFDFAENYIKRKNGKTRDNYRKSIEHFRSYSGNIDFKDITIDHLYGFKRYLEKQKGRKYQNLSPNYIHLVFVQLKAIVNAAVKEELTLKNAFSHVSIKKEQVIKSFLDPEEIKKIEEFDLESMLSGLNKASRLNSKLELARDYFLLAYYTGLRISDVFELVAMIKANKYGKLKANQGSIDQDGVISKRHKKTGQIVRFQLNPKAWAIFQKYNQEIPSIVISAINRNIKKIGCALGFEKNMHIHMTNHSLSTNLYEMGFTIEEIADYQGKDPATIRAHYVQKNKLELSKKINKAFK